MTSPWNDQLEWLETDGLGGFASGTAGGIRTRRYHGLLLAATIPPTGRFILVNGLDVSVDTPAGSFPLSSQRYDGQVVHPESFRFIRSFTTDPWPTWRLHLLDGTVIEHELFMPRFQPTVVLSWRVCDGGARRRQKREARRRSVEPLTRHLRDVGLNHVSEVADAEAPHMPRGCPFQAWSVAELLRLDAVLAAPVAKPLDASLHPMCG